MSIHSQHPFFPAEEHRSALRRLRGRLVAPVTLWTAGKDHARAGLTVTSALLADGEPGRLLGIVDAEAELWAAIERTGRLVMAPLSPSDQHLADVFGGVAPAPGGPFRLADWRETAWGPVLRDATSWCGCRLLSAREVGYGLLVDAAVERIEVGNEPVPLAYHRGRYRSLDLGRGQAAPPE